MSKPEKCDYCNVDVHVRRADDDIIEVYCPKCGRFRVYRVERLE
jgi:predicted RNA-binding Zn-ribbon protein involved in translation (DUF1610 family)